MRTLALVVALVFSGACHAAGPVHFPQTIDPDCRGGRAQIYDECSSQFDVLNAAMAEAERTGKIVMVVYGAEWCIWCHVFDKYLAGQTGTFKYNLEGDRYTLFEGKLEEEAAEAVRDYAARTFVLAHIEDQYSSDGYAVLEAVGAAEHMGMGIPYIFTLRDGRFAARMRDTGDLPEMEVRREGFLYYRGYDRAMLLDELRRVADAAR